MFSADRSEAKTEGSNPFGSINNNPGACIRIIIYPAKDSIPQSKVFDATLRALDVRWTSVQRIKTAHSPSREKWAVFAGSKEYAGLIVKE